LAREMGIPAGELVRRMSAAEFAEHIAEMNLSIRERQQQ
jgi:hypothetical protein